MKLEHIDNCFFKLTPAQAKALCFHNELPKHGYEKLANPDALNAVRLFEGGREWRSKATEAARATVKRTVTQGKQVWALSLYFRP